MCAGTSVFECVNYHYAWISVYECVIVYVSVCVVIRILESVCVYISMCVGVWG